MDFAYKSPLGWLKLTFSDNKLIQVSFCDSKPGEISQNLSQNCARRAVSELTEYFKGERKRFTIPVNPQGTSFQKAVWQQLQQIPYGHTTSYGELAKKLGDPNKVRAVGRANGQNPIPIIIPCHRVIGSNNNLIGYAGGISRKKYLLKHEGALLL